MERLLVLSLFPGLDLNLIPEFERVIGEAAPQWFLMENVPDAPTPKVKGYDVYSYILNNRQCVDEDGNPATQNRVRRFSWGWRGEGRPPLLIDVVTFESPEFEYAACGGSSEKNGLTRGTDRMRPKRNKRTGAKMSKLPFNGKGAAAAQELCRKQGLPVEFLEHLPFRSTALCKAIGNGVPQPMGRAIARAVKDALSPP